MKPIKIVGLTQAEIDYVAEFTPDSPALSMLANVVKLMRTEISLINATYLIDTAKDGVLDSDLTEKWKKDV